MINYICRVLTLSVLISLHSGFASVPKIEDNYPTKISKNVENTELVIIKGPLKLKSVSLKDVDDLLSLYQDPEILKWVGAGTISTEEQVLKRVRSYIHCWKESLCKRIFSYNMYFSVWLDNLENNPKAIGVLNIHAPHDKDWNMNEEGCLEISGFGDTKFQNKGYATQTFRIILQEFIPYLQDNNYTVGGRPIQILQATSRPDNGPSNAVLRKFFKSEPILVESIEYGFSRNLYELSVARS